MFKLTLVCVGKLKEKYWNEAEAEYLKRLGPAGKIRIMEIPEETLNSNHDDLFCRKKEAEKIEKLIKPDALAVALCLKGESINSEKFSEKINNISQNGQEIIFLIGGPTGLDSRLIEKSDWKISLSKMTFTHQMARIILLEQIYRAFTIATGKKYHL